MQWFNYIGLIYIVLIMIPNVIFMLKQKSKYQKVYNNKTIETLEQIGRFGCLIFMIFNILYMYYGFWFQNGFLFYLIIGSSLVFLYLISWFLFRSKHLIARSYILSIIPSVLFIFSGIMLINIPLIVFSLIFAFCHITISLKNAYHK